MTRLSNEIKISDFIVLILKSIKFLLSKWLTILVISILFASIGILYAFSKSASYTSEITFVTENGGNDQIKSYASIAAQFGLDFGTGNGGAFEGENLIEFFKSRNIIIKTLLSKPTYANDLFINIYINNYNLNNGWKKYAALQNLKFNTVDIENNRTADSVLTIVYKKIINGSLGIIKKDKKLNYFNIQFKDKDERFAKEFLEKLLNNTIQFYVNYKIQKAISNVNILQKQTDSVKALLVSNLSSVNEINDLNINPIKQLAKTPVQKKQIDQQVNTVLYTELFKNLELAKLALRKETPLIQVIDASRYPLQKNKLSKLITGTLFAISGNVIYFICFICRRWYKKQTSSILVAV